MRGKIWNCKQKILSLCIQYRQCDDCWLSGVWCRLLYPQTWDFALNVFNSQNHWATTTSITETAMMATTTATAAAAVAASAITSAPSLITCININKMLYTLWKCAFVIGMRRKWKWNSNRTQISHLQQLYNKMCVFTFILGFCVSDIIKYVSVLQMNSHSFGHSASNRR